jgi:type II secretory pathway pseudopilin PulG
MKYIKTNNKWARQRGTTLVELSVVIAVILLLVSVLFIGISAWKNGANRAACLVNLASLQKAVRGYQNLHSDDTTITTVALGATGDTAASKTLVGDGYFGAPPVCPTKGDAYVDNMGGAFPAAGVAAFTCPLAGAPDNHAPTAANLANW